MCDGSGSPKAEAAVTTPTLAELIGRVPHDIRRVGGISTHSRGDHSDVPSDTEPCYCNLEKVHQPDCPRCSLESWHREALGMVDEWRMKANNHKEKSEYQRMSDLRERADALARRLGGSK